MGAYAHNSTLENNEIAYNGWEQKVTESANVTFRNNFVHHNVGRRHLVRQRQYRRARRRQSRGG